LIQVDGDITIDGIVKNEVSGTGGRPGDITIVTKCGDITVGPKGYVQDIGVDPGGGDINLLACCDGADIVINGLVEASYKGAVASTINIVSFMGSVTIDGNIDDPQNPGQKITNVMYTTNDGPFTSGVRVYSRRDPLGGAINIQAFEDVTVLGNTVLVWQKTNWGVVGGNKKATNGQGNGGDLNVVSLNGKIIASDRAFDLANRFNHLATIDLLAKGNIELTATGRSNSVQSGNAKAMAVVSTQAGSSGTGGTNTLRSYSGDIFVGDGVNDYGGEVAQVLANGTTAGTNLLTSCSGVNVYTGVDGEVNPADLVPGDDSGVCAPSAPTALFTDCQTDFGVGWVCGP
jgi:hypothetical protein